MRKWHYDRFESIGRGHLAKNIPCQDKTYIKEENQILVLALSDGCGSSKWSHFGAEITTKTICDLLVNEFDSIYNNQDGVQIKSYLLNKIVEALETFAELNQYKLVDLDSTLLFAAKKDNRHIIGRLGDGVIGIVRDNILSIASTETKNEEVNSTYYPSMIRRSNTATVYNEFDLRKTDKAIDGIFLMSDGSADSLIDRRTPFQMKFANAVPALFNLIKKYDSKNPHDEIQKFLDNSIINKTSDDCSLVIACDESLVINQIKVFDLPKPVDIEKTIDASSDIEYIEEIIDIRPIDVLKENTKEFIFKYLIDEGFQFRDLDRLYNILCSKRSCTLNELIIESMLDRKKVRIVLTNFYEFKLVQFNNDLYKVIDHE